MVEMQSCWYGLKFISILLLVPLYHLNFESCTKVVRNLAFAPQCFQPFCTTVPPISPRFSYVHGEIFSLGWIKLFLPAYKVVCGGVVQWYKWNMAKKTIEITGFFLYHVLCHCNFKVVHLKGEFIIFPRFFITLWQM